MEKFEKLPYPIMIISNGKITYINKPFSILFGYKEDEILGKEYKEIMNKEIRPKESYADTGYFYTKDGNKRFYSFSITPIKDDLFAIELKGLNLAQKILESTRKKLYVWKREEIIDSISKSIIDETSIERIRVYLAKDKKLEELIPLYEFSKGEGRWEENFSLNNLPAYNCKDFPEYWSYTEIQKENIPNGLREYIERDKISSLISKVICINHRTLYILSYESKNKDIKISSLEINLLIYIEEIIREILYEKLEELYEKNLKIFRKKLLSLTSREELTKLLSHYLPIKYDKLIMGFSWEEKDNIGILITDDGKDVKKTTFPITKKAIFEKILISQSEHIEKITYGILDKEDLKKLGELEEKLKIQDISSTIFVYLKENGVPDNFIGLLKTEKEYYVQNDLDIVNPFVEEALLALQKFTIMEEAKMEKTRAENALKIQKFFLERISHEFRTPITGILGFSDLLSENVKSLEEKEYLSAIRESTLRLLSLVDKLLLLARLEAGYFTIRETAFTLDELKMWLKDEVKKTIKHNLTYMINIPHYPHSLIGDLDKIKIIFKELIENAIKFTNEGRIDIIAEVIKEGAEEAEIRFSIRDTGVGIAEDKVKYIFSNFAQEEEDTARSYEGMGLGLSIVKKIIENMGGLIWVESNKDKGSTFYFQLKIKRELRDKFFKDLRVFIDSKDELVFSLLKIYILSLNATLVLSEEGYDIKIEDKDIVLPISKKDVKYILYEKFPNKENSKIEKKDREIRVLIAEDNPLNYKYAKKIMENMGFIVENAKTGREAVDMAKEKEYNIIFMDIQMPVLDGIEATKIIRETNKEIPIIALTAAAVEEVEKEAREAGVNEYITKPFTKEKIIEIVDRYINKNG